MSQMGFESTIPVFKRAKTVHALDHAAILIDVTYSTRLNYRSMGNLWPIHISVKNVTRGARRSHKPTA
jgi:P pilus assembly chaperone PapD